MCRTAVVLFNLGGPDSLDAVEPFLFNLFMDPEIIAIPFGSVLRKPLARFISRKRSQKVKVKYEQIGGKSPINELTEKQRSLLEQSLRDAGYNADVFTAMRYWHPLVAETVRIIENGSYRSIILLPLYPQYSFTTTRTVFSEWQKQYSGTIEPVEIHHYFLHPTYLAAMNKRINESLGKFPEYSRSDIELVFSAHSVPVSIIEKGDPYKDQIEQTVNEIMKMRENDLPYHLCYQGKVGPVKWLEPATNVLIRELAQDGKKNLLVIPVSFVSDHLETVHELDIQFRAVAEEAGTENYAVMEGLNESPLFIQALTEIISEKMQVIPA